MMMKVLLNLVYEILMAMETMVYMFAAFFAFCIFWFMYCNSIPSTIWYKLVALKHWAFCAGCERCCTCICCIFGKEECECDECKCCVRE